MRRALGWIKIGLGLAVPLSIIPALTGCRSNWVNATVENQTGQPVRELEVDYPTASFGSNALNPGASMHYRFQIRGDGPIKVEYTGAGGTVFHAQGLTLSERQQGQILILLLPSGKVQFVPNLQPAS